MNTFTKVAALFTVLILVSACNGFDVNNSDCAMSKTEAIDLSMKVALNLTSEKAPSPQSQLTRKVQITLEQMCCDGKHFDPVVAEGLTVMNSERTAGFNAVSSHLIDNTENLLVVTARLYNADGLTYLESTKVFTYMELVNSGFEKGKYLKHCSFESNDFLTE